MKWAAKLLVIALALAGSRAIFLSSPSCCPMGGDMACCLVAPATGCALRSCTGNGDSVLTAGTAARAVLAPPVTLPRPSLGILASPIATPLALARSDAPPSPPPRA